jgi:hypothetical protein
MPQLNIDDEDKKIGFTVKEDGTIVDKDGKPIPVKNLKEALDWIREQSKK